MLTLLILAGPPSLRPRHSLRSLEHSQFLLTLSGILLTLSNTMLDENAFGVLVSYFGVEDDEYGLEREPFVARFRSFREVLRATLRDVPLGNDVRAIDLGHAWYVEVADGDQTESPLSWAKKARARLAEEGFDTVAVVTHGGRWVDEGTEGWVETEALGSSGLLTVSHPSEPLRRALYADAATRPDDDDDGVGWGPGLYLDVEAVEALGIRPKNEPTLLRASGATFLRAGT